MLLVFKISKKKTEIFPLNSAFFAPEDVGYSDYEDNGHNNSQVTARLCLVSGIQ